MRWASASSKPSLTAICPGMAGGERAEAGFHRLVAAAEDGQLGRQVGDAFAQREDEVESLLVRQAADDAEQRTVGSDIEPHFLLQRALVVALGGQPVGGIGGGQRGVAGRVPERRVDAVQDAAQRAGAVAQQGREAVAEGFVLDFPGVGRADRRDQRRQLQPGLEEGKQAVVLDAVHVPGMFGQAEGGQVAGGEVALEGDVVHGDDAGGAAFVVQPGGGERGLPVIDVHDVRLPAERRAGLPEQRGDPGKQAEADAVVDPVVAMGVQVGTAGTVEQGRAVEQDQRQAVGLGAEQAGRRQRRGQWRQFGEQGRLGKGLEQGRVGRQQHADVMLGPVQRRRQRGGDVAEAAGLDPGGHFGGGEKDGKAAHQVLRAASRPRVEASKALASPSPSSTGVRRLASCLPSSTPHWSKELRFHSTPRQNTLCS